MTLTGFIALGIAGLVVVIALAVGGYIFNVSQKASHQTSPTGAVDSFLDATLNERSTDAVEKYLCDKKSVKQQTSTLIEDLKKYQKKYPDNSVSYLWSSPRLETKHGDHATVTSNVTARTIINGATSDAPTQLWAFGLANQGGWKVCGVTMGS